LERCELTAPATGCTQQAASIHHAPKPDKPKKRGWRGEFSRAARIAGFLWR
jgi:hypothetical protein